MLYSFQHMMFYFTDALASNLLFGKKTRVPNMERVKARKINQKLQITISLLGLILSNVLVAFSFLILRKIWIFVFLSGSVQLNAKITVVVYVSVL